MGSVEDNGASSVIAFEFVVGVTGHRDLVRDDFPALTEEVFNSLDEIRRNFTRLPLRLVTGLAEGADTLAAEVALDMGLPVTAVLPMPLRFYEEDFDGPALKRFRELLQHDMVDCFEIPLARENADKDALTSEDRVIQYKMLMDFLNRRSNVLMALWDGKMLTDKGGTSDVIGTYLSGRNLHRTPTMLQPDGIRFEDCGELAIWIKTRRAKDPDGGATGRAGYLVSDASGVSFQEHTDIPNDFIERWRGLEHYAADRFSDAGVALATWPLAHDDVLGGSAQAKAINREFLRADQLAMVNQKYSDGLFKAFGLIAGAMGLFFLVYAKLADLKVFLVFYVGLFVVVQDQRGASLAGQAPVLPRAGGNHAGSVFSAALRCRRRFQRPPGHEPDQRQPLPSFRMAARCRALHGTGDLRISPAKCGAHAGRQRPLDRGSERLFHKKTPSASSSARAP